MIHQAAPLSVLLSSLFLCFTGAVADKWYVSLPPQVHLSTVTALDEDGESACCDVTSDVSDDVTVPPCYCQQEQHQGRGQYELLAVT